MGSQLYSPNNRRGRAETPRWPWVISLRGHSHLLGEQGLKRLKQESLQQPWEQRWDGLVWRSGQSLTAHRLWTRLPVTQLSSCLHWAFLCGPTLILHLAHLQAVPAFHGDRLPSRHALCEPADVQQHRAGGTWGRGCPARLPADGLLG